MRASTQSISLFLQAACSAWVSLTPGDVPEAGLASPPFVVVTTVSTFERSSTCRSFEGPPSTGRLVVQAVVEEFGSANAGQERGEAAFDGVPGFLTS